MQKRFVEDDISDPLEITCLPFQTLSRVLRVRTTYRPNSESLM